VFCADKVRCLCGLPVFVVMHGFSKKWRFSVWIVNTQCFVLIRGGECENCGGAMFCVDAEVTVLSVNEVCIWDCKFELLCVDC